ncbi:MAG: PilC/PilY family type IV pilus protein [Pseudomonadota bacterium]
MSRSAFCTPLLAALMLAAALPSQAKDTDIYRPTVKPNVMIMFDNSASMEFGVYESMEDYGRFYDYLSELTCGSGSETRDAICGGTGTSNYFYGPLGRRTWTRNEIVTLAGDIGYAQGPDGRGYTGDPGDPNYLWYINNISHTDFRTDPPTNWVVNSDGTHTIETDNDGYVLFNGSRLPNGRSIKVHDLVRNADGSMVDRGLAGLLNAPGWYFSGYFFDSSNHLTANPSQARVVNGRKMVVFFIPGNWISMQCVYNLYIASGCPDGGQPAWKFLTDGSANFWQSASYSLTSPGYPGNYPNNYHNEWTITRPGASSVRIHFSDFNTKNSSDPVKLYDARNNLVVTYSGNKGAFTSQTLSGNTVKIDFTTNSSGQAKGWSIDRIEYQEGSGGGYRMERRIDVAREAILEVIDATLGKLNWGLAKFNYQGGDAGNGATVVSPLNPNFNDDQNRQNLVNHLNALETGQGTPLCESAQDIYNYYHQHTNILRECTKNYAIYCTDGYPSADSDNSRLTTGYALTNSPADSFTQDPYQYPSPAPDLFDDATGYAYRHSVYDGSVITSPEASSQNVVSHCIGFSLEMPLLDDAAADGGGYYCVAFNKQQLISAFYSLGLLIIENASYTAPVVSVDSANKTQNGDELFMSFFKPMSAGLGYWGGNLKRYGLNMRIKGNCTSPRTKKEWVVVDHPGGSDAPDSTDCAGEFKEHSFSWWDKDGQPDGDDVSRGGTGEIIYQQLNTSSPYARPIYTWSGSGIIRFTPDNVTNSMLGVSTDEERYKVVNFTYGFTFEQDPVTHRPVAKRSWPLGDMIHSEPAIIDYFPCSGGTTPTERLLVVGANDGMLHVFDADSGAERWAFIPPDLLPKLRTFDPEMGMNQQDMVDGPASLVEDGTQKILIFGERRGGRSYYALNVTNPDPRDWSMQWVGVGGTASPGIIGGSTPGFEELGQSWSRPQAVSLMLADNSKRPVVIFGGGYDPEEDEDNPGARTMGRALYVVDLHSGNIIYHFDHDDNSNLLCVPADVAVVTNSSDCLDYLYFVDTAANVWKTSYRLDEHGHGIWETRRLFAGNPGSTSASGYGGTGTGALDNADRGRKMFYPPDVSLGDEFTDQPVLYVGTGDREHPLDSGVSNRFYCIIDDGSESLDERHLLNVTGDELQPDSGISYAERQRITNLLTNAHGWYIKMDGQGSAHDGEKVLSQPTVFAEVVYFTTFVPLSARDSCNPLGEALVYALRYSRGTAVLDYDGDGRVEKDDRSEDVGHSIASRVKIVIRGGVAAGFVSVGGKVAGAGEGGTTRIPQPGAGIQVIFWRPLDPKDNTSAGAKYGH